MIVHVDGEHCSVQWFCCLAGSRYGVRFSGRGHLRENLVEPHEWAMEMHLYPARSARHILAMVLCPPALHKAHANGAHLCQLKDGFKALVDALCQQLGKVLVVEDL